MGADLGIVMLLVLALLLVLVLMALRLLEERRCYWRVRNLGLLRPERRRNCEAGSLLLLMNAHRQAFLRGGCCWRLSAGCCCVEFT